MPSSSATNSLWYVYGVVRSDARMPDIPTGLDDAPVALEPLDGVAALVSVLSGPDYTPEAIEARSGDVEWLSPRAVSHDQVLTWASDRGAVIPMPMFLLFSSRDAVHDMLRDREPQLLSTLDRTGDAREFALRVYRVDAELLASVAELSPRLRDLAASAASAAPGQRYLLERKLDGERRTEMRSVTQQIVEEIVTDLTPCAKEVARSPIPKVADADSPRGTMVLNAAFLIAGGALPEFQRTLTAIIARHDPHGMRFDFTGPWPAYHFVNETPHVD